MGPSKKSKNPVNPDSKPDIQQNLKIPVNRYFRSSFVLISS